MTNQTNTGTPDSGAEGGASKGARRRRRSLGDAWAEANIGVDPARLTPMVTEISRVTAALASTYQPLAGVDSALSAVMANTVPTLPVMRAWAEMSKSVVSSPSVAGLIDPGGRLTAQMTQTARLALANTVPTLPVIRALAETVQPSVLNASAIAGLIDPGGRLAAQMAASAQVMLSNVLPGYDMPSLWLPTLPIATALQDSLESLLRTWRVGAGLGSGLTRIWALWALRAARAARRAAIRGDWAEVAEFITEWLDLAHPGDAHIQAASEVLLDDFWEPEPGDGLSDDNLHQMRIATERRSRWHRPPWETTIGTRRLVPLETPVPGHDGTSTTLGALQPVPAAQEPVSWGWADPRLLRLETYLSPTEQAVVRAYALVGGSWADAATAAGFAGAVGEAVRRKIKRLAQDQARRDVLRRG